MTQYTKNTNFSAKDSLATGSSAKAVSGSVLDAEFSEIQAAVNSMIENPTTKSTGQYLQYNGSAWVAVTVITATPVGSIIPYGGSADTGNYLLCDGRSLDTTVYSALYNVIGYSYGGSGSDFNLPDLRGRTIAGIDDMGTAQGAASRLGSNTYTHPVVTGDEDTLGSSTGTEQHQLVNAEMPTNPYNVPTALPVIISTQLEDVDATTGNLTSVLGDNSAFNPHSFTTGGNGSHDTMQPTLLVNYLIQYQ